MRSSIWAETRKQRNFSPQNQLQGLEKITSNKLDRDVADVAAFAWQRRPVHRLTCFWSLIKEPGWFSSSEGKRVVRERVGVAKQTPLRRGRRDTFLKRPCSCKGQV